MSPVLAHGGHDHSAPQPVMQASYTQVEAVSTAYEMLLRYEPGEPGTEIALELFLSRFDDNSPVDGAVIELRVEGEEARKVALTQAGEGRYIGRTEALSGETASVTALVTGASPGDILVAEGLPLHLPPHEDMSAVDEPAAPPVFWVGLGLLALLCLGLLAWAARRFQTKTAMPVALLLGGAGILGVDGAAWAHGGHDHGGGSAQTQAAAPGQAALLPKEAQNLLQVRTGRVEQRQVTPRLTVTGTVTVPPGHAREVKAPMAGRLEPAEGLSLGKTVKAGELLYTLVAMPDASDRASLIAEQAREKAQISSLQTRVSQTRRAYERAKALAAQDGMMSQSELDAAEAEYAAARSALQASKAAVSALSLSGESLRIPIYSPLDGEVAAISALSGEVLADALLLRVVDRSELLVAAKVLETDLSRVRLESIAEVRAGETRVKAHHVFTGLEVDPTTRAVEVLYRVEADKPLLWLSQFVSLALPAGLAVNATVVPESALIDMDGRPSVWVKRSAEVFEPVNVLELAREDGMVGVRGAIKVGDRVVTQGAAFLRGARAAEVR